MNNKLQNRLNDLRGKGNVTPQEAELLEALEALEAAERRNRTVEENKNVVDATEGTGQNETSQENFEHTGAVKNDEPENAKALGAVDTEPVK